MDPRFDPERRFNERRPLPGVAEAQPAPTPGRVNVIRCVMADLAARAAKGTEKYGTPLHTNNGRDALMDAYQEAIDLCCYLRQAIEEKNGSGNRPEVPELPGELQSPSERLDPSLRPTEPDAGNYVL